MTDSEQLLEKEWEAYLSYAYTLATSRYSDHPDLDSLVQDTIMTLIEKKNQGAPVAHPKGFLSAVMKNKYNEFLRQKYRNRIVLYDSVDGGLIDTGENVARDEEEAVRNQEYMLVRRELSRLCGIYREVTVRYYVHGHSVEQIAEELHISAGTVKSRLSSARGQIKEGLKGMEKYDHISYEPKRVTLSIWGSTGFANEPFSLLPTQIEANILILAYEKPLPIRQIADAMGIPTAYIEPIVDRLVDGQLLGKTASGLIYTRCFVIKEEDSHGNIPLQETLADQYAQQVWDIIWRHIEPLTHNGAFRDMSEKQRATMLLFMLRQTLSRTVQKSKPCAEDEPKEPPERPNGGRWLATVVVRSPNVPVGKYDSSGPVLVNYRKEANGHNDCQLFDCQSLFGDTHWAYSRLKYSCSLAEILQFYASFLPCDVKTTNKMYELIPEFEKMHILKRDSRGEIHLDIPALPYEEIPAWTDAERTIEKELYELLEEKLRESWLRTTHHVPKYVDGYAHYLHSRALGAYPLAQMLAIVNKHLMPYAVEIGKTPIIYIAYRKSEKEK